MRLWALVGTLLGTAASLLVQGQSPISGASGLDAALQAFWDATDVPAAERAGRAIVALGPSASEMYGRLTRGRTYQARPTGGVELPTRIRGVAHDNVVEIPRGYDPRRAWPLRVTLHGGVGREAPAPGDPPARPLRDRTPIEGEIVLHPRAWSESAWWTPGQVDNVARLIARVRRDYNVDESRTYVTGISDGGTGVYFLAMRDATPWAACLPLNGHPAVIANPDTGADGQLHAGNAVNCPMRAVNGGLDPLYPAASVAPLIEMFRRAGGPVEFQVYPGAGHNVNWWPDERPRYEAFLAAHRREAHPGRISWETERTDRYHRFRWLVIDGLGRRPSDVALEDVNAFSPTPGLERRLFDRARASGRVDAVRRGNRFEVTTRGVRTFTLLLSPDVIDFAEPVRVIVNGRLAHDHVVQQDVSTLVAWAARDQDRTMLYTASLQISVP